MNDQMIQKIIANRIPCYFISPHLDDAVLSAGGLIAHLSKHTQVEVVTVFTNASPRPYTFSIKMLLNQCEYIDADELFTDCRREDREACALVGAKPHHLGHTDALWRKIPSPHILRRILSHVLPEFLYVYPTYRMHVIRGGISRYDKSLVETLGKELSAIVAERKDAIIFCPLALRSHIDHVLVRDVCLANFDNVFMWQDFPYNMKNGLGTKEISSLGKEAFRWDAEKDMKKKMIESYVSQIHAMFPDGNIPLVPEVYYTASKYALAWAQNFEWQKSSHSFLDSMSRNYTSLLEYHALLAK